MQPLSMLDVDAALRYLIQAEGSDLHLKVPVPPTARIHGHLGPLEGEEGRYAFDFHAISASFRFWVTGGAVTASPSASWWPTGSSATAGMISALH